MHKPTLQCKIEDLGMVLDLGQGESQQLDQVRDAGISSQAVSEKITLLSLFPSLTLFLVLDFCFCFALFFSLQRLKTSVQLFSTQVAWPFYDLLSLLP